MIYKQNTILEKVFSMKEMYMLDSKVIPMETISDNVHFWHATHWSIR